MSLGKIYTDGAAETSTSVPSMMLFEDPSNFGLPKMALLKFLLNRVYTASRAQKGWRTMYVAKNGKSKIELEGSKISSTSRGTRSPANVNSLKITWTPSTSSPIRAWRAKYSPQVLHSMLLTVQFSPLLPIQASHIA